MPTGADKYERISADSHCLVAQNGTGNLSMPSPMTTPVTANGMPPAPPLPTGAVPMPPKAMAPASLLWQKSPSVNKKGIHNDQKDVEQSVPSFLLPRCSAEKTCHPFAFT